jgi:methanogenic corrinoid protein MtbC1
VVAVLDGFAHSALCLGSETGATFFSSRDHDSHSLRATLLAHLEAELDDEDRRSAAVVAAAETFRAFLAWFDAWDSGGRGSMNSVFAGKDGPSLAAKAVELFYRRHPTAVERYPPGAREKCAEDMLMHLLCLDAAEFVDSHCLLLDYLAWVKGLFSNLGLPVADLRPSLECLADVIAADGNVRGGRQADMLRRALDELDRRPPEFSSLACSGAGVTGPADRFLSALLAWDQRSAEKLVIGAVNDGAAIPTVYLEVIAPALHELGRLWHAARITVAQEHYVSSATQVIMSQLYPRVFAEECKGPVLVATCVEGELHEIGLRMVSDLFQLEGWDTRFLGANTPPKAVVALADQVGAAVVAVSAMILATVPSVANQVALLRAGPGGAGRKILVGGYPFNVDRDLWRRVGADGTAPDGRHAVTAANRLLAGAE